MREHLICNFSQHPEGWKSKPSNNSASTLPFWLVFDICSHLAPGPTACLLLFRGLQRHEKVISIIYNKALLTTTQETWLDVFFWNRILSATSTSVFYSRVVQECDPGEFLDARWGPHGRLS